MKVFACVGIDYTTGTVSAMRLFLFGRNLRYRLPQFRPNVLKWNSLDVQAGSILIGVILCEIGSKNTYFGSAKAYFGSVMACFAVKIG